MATCAHGVFFRFENPTVCELAAVWSLELGHGTSVQLIAEGW